ncbi:glycosyltransferase family 2 protein, partial [Vibrio cyclitrophicus]
MFKVSVVVPFYNASRYIEKCVISLMEQKLDAIEYIFIDDGSTDNSLTILNHVLSLYPSRKVATRVVSRCNKGVTFSRNEGMQLATGQYLIFIDSDDWVESNFLDLMYEQATMYSSDIIICDYISHSVCGVNYISQKFEPNDNCQLIKSIFNDDVQGFLWNKLIKTDLYKDVNGFDLDVNYMEDIL